MANRVDFRTDDYNDVIKQKGMKAKWEQAIVCECITPDSGQPNFTCPHCHGSGFRYLPAQDIRVVSTSFSSSVKLETLGVREPGTAYITPPSTVVMGYRDRLKFIDFSCKYSETLRIDSVTKFSNKTHRNIRSIVYLIKGNSQYELNTDFKITSDGHHIQWINNTTLPSGTLSILYMTTPSYLVVDLLHELRATYIEHKVPTETFKEFPKQYQIRREDFVYGVNSPVPTEQAQNTTETPATTAVERNPVTSGSGTSTKDEYDY